MNRSNKKREKHRKADKCHEADEDFPRGPQTHSSSGTFKAQRPHRPFHHSSHYHKPGEDKPAKEGRWGKHKKKGSYVEDDSNDNLFLIKQRKKKSKQWNSLWFHFQCLSGLHVYNLLAMFLLSMIK